MPELENPIITVKIFDGHPFGEITVDPEYISRGEEQELLHGIIALIRDWQSESLRKKDSRVV